MKWPAAIAIVVVAGCAPQVAQPDRRPRAQTSFESATGQPAEIEKLLRGSVVNGGLWWNNADCFPKFPVTAEIRADLFHAFARCLAGLQLVPSDRAAALPDVKVFRYEPGFEIEARIVDDMDGPRLAWIGFVGRSGPNDSLPTITSAALESLRLAGTPHGPLDPNTPGLEPLAQRSASTWFKLCIDAEGNVTRLDPRHTTSPSVMRMFEAAAATWRFRPFVANGQTQPVCSMILMRYPATPAAEVETLPMPVGEGRPLSVGIEAMRLVSGERTIVPDDEGMSRMRKLGTTQLTGTFRACTDQTGKVVELQRLRSTGQPTYDQRILTAIASYVYEPIIDQGRPIPVCTIIPVVYTRH